MNTLCTIALKEPSLSQLRFTGCYALALGRDVAECEFLAGADGAKAGHDHFAAGEFEGTCWGAGVVEEGGQGIEEVADCGGGGGFG